MSPHARFGPQSSSPNAASYMEPKIPRDKLRAALFLSQHHLLQPTLLGRPQAKWVPQEHSQMSSLLETHPQVLTHLHLEKGLSEPWIRYPQMPTNVPNRRGSGQTFRVLTE